MKNNADYSPVPVNYFLKPGFVYLPGEPTIISTVLGSCVSVCLYDRKRKKGGMNRVQYPWVEKRHKSTPQYGNAAIIALIRIMLDDGSRKKDLEAQILGGADNPDVSKKDMGRDNVKVAGRILMKAGITVSSEDTGGDKGRKVVFNSTTNDLAVFKVERLREADRHPYERGIADPRLGGHITDKALQTHGTE